MKFTKIILASQSPRRSQLLRWADVPFEVIATPTEENYPPELPGADIAQHIALNKARAARKKILDTLPHLREFPLIAADTIVVLDGTILNKPADRDAAIRMLSELSGRTHSVITGVVILYRQKEYSFAEETLVSFHTLSKDQIEYYVDQYPPFDKAGSYAIQEWIGITGIRSITGDFYNVMGLPVSRLLQQLDGLEG